MTDVSSPPPPSIYSLVLLGSSNFPIPLEIVLKGYIEKGFSFVSRKRVFRLVEGYRKYLDYNFYFSGYNSINNYN